MTTPVNSRRLALEAVSPRVLKVGDNYINLTVTSQQFRIGTNNVSNPTSVTFTASLVGVLSGTVTFNTNVIVNQFVAGTTFTGTIAAGTNILTTVNTPGTPVVGMILSGGNIEPNTYIVSGSGTSWIVSKTQITATSSATLTGTPYTQSGNQLTITPEIMTGDYVVITASLTYQNVTYTSSPISVSKIYSSIGARLSQTFKTYGSYNDGTGYTISSVADQQTVTNAIYLDLFNGDSAFPRGSAGGITYSPLIGTVVAKDGLKVYLTTDGIVQIVEASSGSWTTDSTNFTLSAIKGGVTYSAIFTVNKQKQGTGGIQYGTISLYRWTVTDPSANSGALLPRGNSTYTWYSQLHVYTPAPTTDNPVSNYDNWSLAPTSKPTDNNNYLLWKITKAIQQQSARDVTVQTLTGIVWNSDYTLTEVTTTSNEFVKTKTATLYQNGTSSVPNFPVGNAKYTWATETLTLSASGYSTILNGWTTTLPTPQTGLTLYSFNVDLIESKSATETAIYWDRGYSKVITVYGPQGVIGNSARRAYVVATGTPAGTPATYTATGDALPAVGTWFTGKTWYSTPQAIAEGEVLYQSDGIYVSGGNTTWGSPYISALKVGNLSAITVNTGDLYVSGSIRGGANSSAVAMDINTGSGYYISSTGSFRVGNPGTNYLKWDGTDLIINTSGAVTIGNTTNYLNWSGGQTPNLSIKTSGNVTIGNPTGTRLQWDGSALSIFQGTTAILTAGQLTWNAISNVPEDIVNSGTVAAAAALSASNAANSASNSANSASSAVASANAALQLVGSVTWLGDSTVSIITGTELRKTAGTDDWNASRYSAESFVGGAFVSFQPYNSVYETMVGLNSDPTTNSSYNSLDYAWYFTGNAAYVYESNAQVAGGWSINNNSVLSIVYDNQYVRYYIDGELKRDQTDTGYGSAKKLYLDTSFKYVNFSGAKNIRFGPNASRGANGSKGDPGNPGGTGAAGARGSATVYLGGQSEWTDSAANTYFTNTYGGKVLNDTMTQYGTGFSTTKFWDGGSWVQVTVAIDGNLLVTGTISAAKLAANTVIANNIEFTGSLNTKSATSGARMEMTNSTIKVYDANGTIRVKIGNLA